MYYLIASVAVVAMCWWMSPPLGIAIAVVTSGGCRKLVVPNAAFWNAGTILTVGIVLGVSLAISINLAANAVGVSTIIKVLLLIEGFFAVGYVGYDPAPEDRAMYNKASQTAKVGMICYVLTSIAITFVLRA